MQINYDITGEKRKALVKAIGQELNAPIKYLYLPTYAFEVSGYHIDKNGLLTGEDNPGLVADLQGLHSFIPVSEEYDNPLPEADPMPDGIQIPNDYEELPAYGSPEPLTIEVTRSDLSDTAIENLKRLVESKLSLIKKALDVEELPIVVHDDTIRFPWFSCEANTETVKAYTHFISALCELAKTQNRVNKAERPVDNEKYAFRCFMLRLGFIGEEFKEERKILLSKLEGNSSFAKGRC